MSVDPGFRGFLRRPIYVCLAIGALGVLTQCADENSADDHTPNAEVIEIRDIPPLQPYFGKLSDDQILKIENGMDKVARDAMEKESLGSTIGKKFASEVRTEQFGDQIILRIETTLDGKLAFAQHMGSISEQGKNVVCDLRSTDDFHYAGSVCEKTVIETFGSPAQAGEAM